MPICTASSFQGNPEIISDGAGGTIVTWLDARNGFSDVYVQRTTSSGTVLWTADGVPLCTAWDNQRWAQIVSDGAGGAIVTWSDQRFSMYDSNIYAQHINAAGVVQWTTDGVLLCSASENQSLPELVSDGAGGAVVTWGDKRNGGDPDIYAQHINSAGVVQWTVDGVPICTVTGSQLAPEVTSDGAGGAIMTWRDERSGNPEIYLQLINASGTVQWTADGIPICAAADLQSYPLITSDSAGGAIVTWEDERNGNSDIYAQRIDASGTVQWTADGIPICTAADAQGYPEIISDGTGGAIIAWGDRRSGDSEIYLQLINSSGTVQWTADGVSICMDGGHPHYEEYHPYNP